MKMKICPKCEGIFAETKYICPDCGCILESDDNVTYKKLKRNLKRMSSRAVDLSPDRAELVLCLILAVQSILYLIVSTLIKKADIVNSLYLSALDLLIIISVVFKGFLYRTVSWKSFITRLKGGDKEKVYPSFFESFLRKTALIFWTVFSSSLILLSFMPV